jgi:lipopolysaccharide export LptBFGC system permease protein LptF
MKLTPMGAVTRSMMVGMAVGLVLVIGFVIWRALAEDTPGWTAVGFFGSALVCAGLGLWFMRRQIRKAAREAEPMPADAEVTDRDGFSWRFALVGVALAVSALGRAANDDAIFAGVLTGMIAGAVIAWALALRRLVRWEAEHGRKLLQHRKGGFKGVDHYYCETQSPSGRFDRSQEAAVQRA